MLSKNKVSKAVAAWICDQLIDTNQRGASLIDESGGDSIRINSVRQSGSLLFLNIAVADGKNREALELCLKINRQVGGDLPKSTPTPSQAELNELDGTA